ncbi:RNA methyltransferase [Oxalobacter paraformigenes]|uniref:tRNA (cytidine/uridine-2'-O-)-methyltransferase TrmJ n=1 Tax=Oxalobacter paraformigenes TaxID=556268 RepID=C3X266_9BURK|nr:RNA methyltransferase [Oxalobacter paraformigenes]EEO27302.1 RNA methyltransferase, TrmH family, group 1 [Oxalobacter paraformigenes]
MNQPKTDTSIFQSLRFILVGTSHPGNVGAAARAIKTMGFDRLILVRPRFENVLTHEEAIAFASGAQDVLEKAEIVDTIDQALENCQFAAAITARLREFSPPVLTPRQFAETVLSDKKKPCALVFGSERYGLPNEVVEQCQALINIPANPAYSSLNLAQAIQVLAYECRMALLLENGEPARVDHIGFHGDPASVEQINGMFAHLESVLTAIGFLNPDNPKKLMPRLRRLFSRTGLETEEVNILRGIARQMEKQARYSEPD